MGTQRILRRSKLTPGPGSTTLCRVDMPGPVGEPQPDSTTCMACGYHLCNCGKVSPNELAARIHKELIFGRRPWQRPGPYCGYAVTNVEYTMERGHSRVVVEAFDLTEGKPVRGSSPPPPTINIKIGFSVQTDAQYARENGWEQTNLYPPTWRNATHYAFEQGHGGWDFAKHGVTRDYSRRGVGPYRSLRAVVDAAAAEVEAGDRQ